METCGKHRTPTRGGMVLVGMGTGMKKYTWGLPMSLPNYGYTPPLFTPQFLLANIFSSEKASIHLLPTSFPSQSSNTLQT